MRIFCFIVLIAGCAHREWEIDPPQIYDTADVMAAISVILDNYEPLYPKGVDLFHNTYVHFTWAQEPVIINLYYDNKVIELKAGGYFESPATILVVEFGDCIGQTALAHEILHAVIFYETKSYQKLNESQEHPPWFVEQMNDANEMVLQEVCGN
jgi:hypothetical protein